PLGGGAARGRRRARPMSTRQQSRLRRLGAAAGLLSCLLAGGAIAQQAPRTADGAPAGSRDSTPRLPDGTPNLGPLEDGKGFWDRGSGPLVGGADYPPPDEIPFKPWARALFDYRQSTLAKDDPHV